MTKSPVTTSNELPAVTKTIGKESETQWTDAEVRWTAANHNLTDDEDQAAEDDSCAADETSLFQPDPDQTFSHTFQFRGNVLEINLKGYEEQSDTIYISTGLTLWRSSELLCEFIMNEGINRLEGLREQQHGRLRVLELGAGLGLAGILAHKLLCKDISSHSNDVNCVHPTDDNNVCVVMTDGDTNALKLLRQNVQINTKETSSRVTVEQLIWGRQTAEEFQNHHQPFDIILAADAIYVLANVKPLMETVLTLLNRSHGEFWFSYCRRRQVSVQIQDVLAAAESIGLSYAQALEDDDILLYIFRWK